MRYWAIFVCIICVICMGCVKSDLELKTNKPVQLEMDTSRFEISRVNVFDDILAYGDKRAIYILKDTHTGKEWVGISGIGISELGSHIEGEQTYSDER